MGLSSLAWFAVLALLAMMLLIWFGSKQREISAEFMAMWARRKTEVEAPIHAPMIIGIGLLVLIFLMLTKNFCGEIFRSFYTFYLIERFGLSIPVSQLMLFVFLLKAGAASVLIGGVVGDRIGRYKIIWISVLGPLPFTLVLPYVDLLWTGVLTITINVIMASAFAPILIYAMEIMPNRIGLICGLFYGLNFGLGGVTAAFLSVLAES